VLFPFSEFRKIDIQPIFWLLKILSSWFVGFLSRLLINENEKKLSVFDSRKVFSFVINEIIQNGN